MAFPHTEIGFHWLGELPYTGPVRTVCERRGGKPAPPLDFQSTQVFHSRFGP